MTPVTLPMAISLDFAATEIMNGLVLGMVYVIIALGLSLIFGMLGIVNFAHGDMLLVGTYVAWWVNSLTGSFLAALVAAPIVVFVIGLLTERFLLRSIYDRDQSLQLLVTFGLAEVLRQSVQVIWGSTSHNFEMNGWASRTFDFGFFTYPSYQVFLLVASGLTVLGLYVFLTRTDLGLVIRAGSQDREIVQILGMDIDRTYLLVFGLGAGLAGWAGALVGPIRGAYPELGVTILIPAFVVIMVGGVGSVGGTLVSGLLIGLIVVSTGVFSSAMSQVVIYVFMALVLLVRPSGLFGNAEVR